MRVETIITNIGPGLISFNTDRRTSYKLRAGESVHIDKDIWSVLNNTDKNRLERAVLKGTLKVDTIVNAGKLGNCTIVSSTADLPAKSTKHVKQQIVQTAEETPVIEKLGGLGSNTKIVQAAPNVVEGYGLRVDMEDDLNSKIFEHKNEAGFTPTTEGTTNVMPKTANLDKSNTTGLWNNKTPITEEAKAEEPKQEKADITTFNPDDFSEADLEKSQKILELYNKKDYDELLKELKNMFPNKKFTKAQLKKYEDFSELLVYLQS